MGAQLRVVMDPAGDVVGADQAEASLELVRGLVQTAPTGCRVEAIVPSGAAVDLPGLDAVRVLPLSPRALAAAWRRGFPARAGAGLVHAPTLLAPLRTHDRVHDNDQTVVTVWDLRAWERTAVLPPAGAAWQQAMLRRAVRHADAVVVPSHAMAARLGEIAPLTDRIRVIAGAAPGDFVEPADAVSRRSALVGDEEYVVVTGTPSTIAAALAPIAARGLRTIVLDGSVEVEPQLLAAGADAGLARTQMRVLGRRGRDDRAAVLAGARALLATDPAAAWPWRIVEAMDLGLPVVAAASAVHRDVLADGGLLVEAAEFGDALEAAIGADAARLRVLAQDRSRAFGWASAAERVWALHAEL